MCRPLAIPIKAGGGGLSYLYQERKGDIPLFSVVETNITIPLTMILSIIDMSHELPYLAKKKYSFTDTIDVQRGKEIGTTSYE